MSIRLLSFSNACLTVFLRDMARGVAKQDGIVAGRVGSPDAPQAASYQM